MAQLPTPKSKYWYCRTAFLEAVPAIGAFGLSFLLSVRLYQNNSDFLQAISVIAFALLIAISGAWVAFRRLGDEKVKIALDEPKVLKAYARTINREIRDACDLPQSDDGQVRVTVHKVFWDKQGRSPERLMQVIRYAGGRGGFHRRIFSVRSGIIGLAARTREVCIADRDMTEPEQKYRDDLVSEWGYTWDEAETRSGDRKAWMAAPLLDEKAERVIGVLFVDTNRTDVLNVEKVQEIIWRGTQTLAEIVHDGV